MILDLTSLETIFNAFPGLHKISKGCTSVTDDSIIVSGRQGAHEDSDIFLFREHRLKLEGSLASSLHVISETLTWLLAHALQLLSVGSDLIIEFILFKEKVGKVAPPLVLGNHFDKPG